LHRLDENLGADTVVLDAGDLARIAQVLAQVQVEGERYPPELQARVGR
jgi:hypothetical protein